MLTLKYCNFCAGPLCQKVNANEHIARMTCSSCGQIYYENPKILVTCFATWEEKVLWMKRATAPYKGLWSIPAGFMEVGESPQQAAARELFEETRAEIEPESLHFFELGSLMDISQVYLVFRGKLKGPRFSTSDEADEVALFAEAEVPWDRFAYPEIEKAMRQFYQDHARGEYGVYTGQVLAGAHQIQRVPGT